MENRVYTLKVKIEGFVPSIWREIEVSPTTTLFDFHKILQIVMGWNGNKQFRFISEESGLCRNKRAPEVVYKSVRLFDVLNLEGDELTYIYNNDECWVHTIKLEKISVREQNVHYPRCLNGKYGCPFEDCGGVEGYAKILGIASNPGHSDYQDFVHVYGEEFDPSYFDKEDVNQVLDKTVEYDSVAS